MHTIILVNKNGTLSQKQVKSFDKLHTSCSYRNNNNFQLLHTWIISPEIVYELYGKKHKKLNNENVYTFYGLQTMFYGNLCIVKYVNGEPDSIMVDEWEKFHGTFETKKVEVSEEELVENVATEIPYTVSDDKELVHEDYEDE